MNLKFHLEKQVRFGMKNANIYDSSTPFLPRCLDVKLKVQSNFAIVFEIIV